VGEQVSGVVERADWQTAAELPQYVFELLKKPDTAVNPVAIVATVDADGTPRTAPFGSVRAPTPGLLRLISLRYHDTFANLVRDGRVSVAVLAPPDISVSIVGRARVVKDEMDTSEHYAIVEIDVAEVKNDMAHSGVIEGAIQFTIHQQNWPWFEAALGELERADWK
jgi:predicted pyridoxine 5'-phosphate oxidase superfamily flavin-nucleotide-binding protein